MDKNATELVHARDDLEKLRSRVLRRLLDDVRTLCIGLSAMEGDHPKPHVLKDKAERVLDSLIEEISNIRADRE